MDSSPTSAELDLPEPEFPQPSESWKLRADVESNKLHAIYKDVYRYNRPLAQLQRASRVANGHCADRVRALGLVIQDLQTAIVDQMEFTEQIEGEIAALQTELPVFETNK